MSTPCTNQADFNKALHIGIKYTNKKNKNRQWMWMYTALWTIFFVWGILLAIKIPAGQMRSLHIVLAIVFSPAYVLAYYLGMLKN